MQVHIFVDIIDKREESNQFTLHTKYHINKYCTLHAYYTQIS